MRISARRRRAFFLLAGLCLALSGAALAPAQAIPLAHAPLLLSSDPESGESLGEAPAEVSATFSEPLDPSSEMAVFDDCERRIDDRNVQVNLNELSVGIGQTPSGTYRVVYKAVGPAGGATGTTNGGFSFTVESGKACAHEDHDDHEGGSGHNGDHGGNHEGNQGDHGEHGGEGDRPADHGEHEVDHGEHAAPEHEGEHQNHEKGRRDPGDLIDPLDPGNGEDEEPADELPPGAVDLFPSADGATTGSVLVALALAALIGGLGGYILRAQNPY